MISESRVLADKKFDAVIFDNDETLVHSMPSIIRSWTKLAQKFNLPMLDSVENSAKKATASFQGMTAAEILERLLPADQVLPALEMIDQFELDEAYDVTAMPGAKRALTILPADKVAVATAGFSNIAKRRLLAAQLPLPEIIVSREFYTNGKPSPEPFLVAAKLLGKDPNNCLVIEDAPAGIAGAQKAGAFTIGLTSTTTAEKLNADLTVENLAALDWVITDQKIQAVLR